MSTCILENDCRLTISKGIHYIIGMVLYSSISLNEEKHPGNLLKEQWLWIWPTSVYWWVSYMNEKVAFCDKHRYRLCKKITWVYIIPVYMHHTKLCIVAITEIHFYEKIPNVRRKIKTKPLPLLTPLKVHCLYTFVSRIINISITGGYFLRHPPFSSLFFQISLSLTTEKIADSL